MSRVLIVRQLLTIVAFSAVIAGSWVFAQENSNDQPLGDVARTLRKKNPAKPVIDDDNLSQAIDQVEGTRTWGSSFRYLMAGDVKGFQVAAPDVTCSLAFTANVKSLLSGQFAEMDLPAATLAKIQAQATVEGDTLTIPVFNGTDWHVSELAVAFTVIQKKGFAGMESNDLIAGSDIASNQLPEQDPLEQVRAEKKPDHTLLYRMRTASPPWERSVFSAPLKIDLPQDAEWHWAIVQAKGYPPESYAERRSLGKKNDNPEVYVPSSLSDVQNPLAVTPQ